MLHLKKFMANKNVNRRKRDSGGAENEKKGGKKCGEKCKLKRN
jgi:hypothetical protein